MSAITKQWSDVQHIHNISLGEEIVSITDPQKILDNIKSSEPNNDTVIKKMNSNDAKDVFIKCSFCRYEIKPFFFTKHIGMHIENKNLISEKNIRVADSVVQSSGLVVSPKEDLAKVKIDDVRTFLNLMPPSKVKDIDNFSFRKIKDVSASSTSSRNGRYSDFTFIVWFADSTSTYNSSYVGVNNSIHFKSSERLQIHLTYDSLERYFTISGRIYKCSGYSDYETEDSSVPDRICEQDELMVEMRRILLFFRLPPKAVYKRFLKIMKRGYLIVRTENEPIQTITINYKSIVEDLKRGKSSNANYYDMYNGE